MAAGFLSAASLFISFDTKDPYESHIGDPLRRGLFKVFEYTTDAFSGRAFVITVLAIAFFFIFSEVFGEKRRLGAVSHEGRLAAFFSVMYVGGRAFRQADSLKVLVSPLFNLLKAFIIFFGFYYLFKLFIRLVVYLMNNSDKVFVIKTDRFLRIRSFYHKHPFWSVFLVIYGLWIPHLILRYPAALGSDDWNQLQFYFGQLPYSSWQPIFHTWLIGSFTNMGITLFNSANAGLFIFRVVESASMALVLAFTLYEMYKWKTALWFRLFTMVLYCFTPYFTGNAAWVIKDYPHMIGYIIWTICIIEVVTLKDLKFGFKKNFWLFVAWNYGAVLMILCRKNGLYIYVAVSFILAIIWLIRLVGKNREKFSFYILAALVLPLAISGMVEHAITVRYNVVPGPIREAFCLPFQQTARYVKEHYEELTDEELEVLQATFDWRYFPTSYDPICADDIKSLYLDEDTSNLVPYFKLWIRQFFKHPMSYIEATWNQNYFIFMPDYDNVVYNQDCYEGRTVATDEFQEWINIHVPKAMQGFPIMVSSMYRMLNQLPFIAIMNNLAIYVYVVFILRRLMQDNKFHAGRLALLPIWLSLAFVLMSPLIDTQPRYGWAVIYILPTIVALYMNMILRRKGTAE